VNARHSPSAPPLGDDVVSDNDANQQTQEETHEDRYAGDKVVVLEDVHRNHQQKEADRGCRGNTEPENSSPKLEYHGDERSDGHADERQAQQHRDAVAVEDVNPFDHQRDEDDQGHDGRGEPERRAGQPRTAGLTGKPVSQSGYIPIVACGRFPDWGGN
jgi:hypothetical protein